MGLTARAAVKNVEMRETVDEGVAVRGRRVSGRRKRRVVVDSIFRAGGLEGACVLDRASTVGWDLEVVRRRREGDERYRCLWTVDDIGTHTDATMRRRITEFSRPLLYSKRSSRGIILC